MRSLPARPSLFPALVALLSAPVALAAGSPVTVSHSGFLLDGNDQPLDAPAASMTFRLHDDPIAGTLLWEGTCAPVSVRAGYYAVSLGGAGCVGSSAGGLDPVLDTTDFAGPRWLAVEIGGVLLAPRVLTSPAPSASDAALLEGHPASDFAAADHTHELADGSTDGFLSAADWTAFHAKVSVEADPKVGTLVNGKWCLASGGKVDCTSDAPAGGSGGGEGSQATAGAASPVECGPTTAGYMHYDASNASAPVLKVCNGASYVTVAAVPAPPGPPSGLAVTAGNTTLSPSWSAVATATSYEVGYQPGTIIDGGAIVVPAAGTSAVLTGLTNGTGYAVAVRSVAGSWRSAWSAVVQATPSLVTTKTLDFNTWPTYDTSFFTVTTNATVRNAVGSLAIQTVNSSGYSFQGATFSVTFAIPAGASNPSLSFRAMRSYQQVLTIRRNGSTIENFSPPNSMPTTPEVRALVAGSTYVLTATVGSTLNGDWVILDDVVVTWN